MSTPRIYLDRFPSFCHKLSKSVEFYEVLTKTNLLSFFLGHGVVTSFRDRCTLLQGGSARATAVSTLQSVGSIVLV